mmetsp:Transcript_28064/g.50564  ORF Transcript_28064/g.50564 Transcript_28064/m.50564 type:complete len:81 (-) Transcript_28064:556-798(-)
MAIKQMHWLRLLYCLALMPGSITCSPTLLDHEGANHLLSVHNTTYYTFLRIHMLERINATNTVMICTAQFPTPEIGDGYH